MQFSLVDIVLVLLVYVILFMMIGILYLLQKRLHLSSIATRNIIHITSGNTMLLLPLFSHWFYPFLIPLGMAIIVGTRLLFNQGGTIRNLMVDENRYSILHSLGPLYYIIMIGVLVPLTWQIKYVGIASILILAWGDGAASLVSQKIKNRHRYPWGDKSLEGSVIMLIFSFLGALVGLTVGMIGAYNSINITNIGNIAIVGAIVATIVEAFSEGHFKPFDNITVPIFSALAIYLISL
jgi:dolichol kinase